MVNLKDIKYSRSVAINVVIANMIGTGVFTSLGYQVGNIPSWFSIMVLWVTGAIISLLGALCYAEIATRIGGSGGEYNFLSKIYSPSLGFIAGWVSLVVGFSAPIAALALAVGSYTHQYLDLPDKVIANMIIILVGLVHIFGIRTGSLFQNLFTRFKILLIIFLILAPILMYNFGSFSSSSLNFNPFNNNQNDWDLIFSSHFAVSLVYVCFSYSGWNASVYFASRIENPIKNIPYSLIVGTLIVSLLYLLLNSAFLFSVDLIDLEGKTDIGNLLLEKLFPSSYSVMSLFFGAALIASLSSMFIAGPSVLDTMGKDYSFLKFLNKKNRYFAPYISIIFLMILAIILVSSARFDELIQYIGVCLSFFSILVVLGVPILRQRNNQKNIYRAPMGSVLAIIFSIVNLWMIYHLISFDVNILWATIGTMLLGYILYIAVPK